MLMTLILLCITGPAQAKADGQPAERPYWLEIAKAHIGECEVRSTGGDAAKELKLHPEPVFHHIQNTRGKSVGSVFLFLEESGRPVAVGDVFFFARGKQHQLYNEWHSLASHPLTVQWQGVPLVTASEPGIKWNPIPDSPLPASNRMQQDRQLRELARHFTAHLIDKSKEKYELRLLTTPLYQYDANETPEDKTGALAGGFFAFCQETDPEIFLLLEVQRLTDGPRWMFAAAEFSNMSLFLQHDSKNVWKADPPQFSGPHFGGHLKDVNLAAPPPSGSKK